MLQKQSELFGTTMRETPAGEEAVNAILLERGGFIYKNSAGVYTFLPLGWRVIERIAQIIREEMAAVDGQELFMPSMVERHYWQTTGRWDVGIGYEVSGKNEKEPGFVLGWSHEDILTAIALRFINSYKDLPLAVFQIQTKFRNEPRAKSGLLRGREFLMKDLYSFHATEEDFAKYYEQVSESYKKIFQRCGLKTIYTLAAGGEFTEARTHEFQTPAAVGEDTIFVCQKCEYAENAEITKLKDGDQCPQCGGDVKSVKSIEVGNIFPLGTKYAEALGLKYTDAGGERKLVIMGSYGIGLGRVMGTIVETSHDPQGIIWPKNVAPFDVHVLQVKSQNAKVKSMAEEVCRSLSDAGHEVLYDDRPDVSAGEKFTDRDLLGLPLSVIVSEKGLADDTVEVVRRADKTAKRVKKGEIAKRIADF